MDKDKDKEEDIGNSSSGVGGSSSTAPTSTSSWYLSNYTFNTDAITSGLNSLGASIQQMNIVETIKKTSDQVVAIYKEDLQEFSNSIISDTSTMVQSQINNVKSNLSPMLGNDQQEEQQDEQLNNNNNNNITSTTSTNSLLSPNLFKGISFFAPDPSNAEDYEQWCKSFDLDSRSFEITNIIAGNETIKSLYSKYVPSEMNHEAFWYKYFYKQYKLQKEEERRLILLKEATKEEEIGWDDDEITFDQQDHLNNNNNNNNITQSEMEIKKEEIESGSIIPNIIVGEDDDDQHQESIDSDEELDREIQQKYLEEEQERQLKLKIKQDLNKTRILILLLYIIQRYLVEIPNTNDIIDSQSYSQSSGIGTISNGESLAPFNCTEELLASPSYSRVDPCGMHGKCQQDSCICMPFWLGETCTISFKDQLGNLFLFWRVVFAIIYGTLFFYIAGKMIFDQYHRFVHRMSLKMTSYLLLSLACLSRVVYLSLDPWKQLGNVSSIVVEILGGFGIWFVFSGFLIVLLYWIGLYHNVFIIRNTLFVPMTKWIKAPFLKKTKEKAVRKLTFIITILSWTFLFGVVCIIILTAKQAYKTPYGALLANSTQFIFEIALIFEMFVIMRDDTTSKFSTYIKDRHAKKGKHHHRHHHGDDTDTTKTTEEKEKKKKNKDKDQKEKVAYEKNQQVGNQQQQQQVEIKKDININCGILNV
ncbi:hypothetical protein DFA_09036 [Cavenderia fasciculata]|uniref:BSD domain-containing protein n=1 Tax=Cavenderia fasciculata TaxID=261658 RepID=F4Q6I8_CACFS|nr:uncharacterized protein DFA_09036 [Cavenderia fasciculata]EGG16498.1 hypothetical protein DFA_09036 [Cavenderia fasciculata]|eukprot:XP_004354898.1 hypothetical protein DFA_09036 [Cavenderia fasciculata]